MALVDYASSSSEEEEEGEEQNHIAEDQQAAKVTTSKIVAEDTLRHRSEVAMNHPHITTTTTAQNHSNKISGASVNNLNEEALERVESPALKLPDASLLLSSPALPSHLANSTDHSSRVAAAMVESESRKRDLKGSSSSDHTRNKVPRGNLPHSRRVPDTVNGHLLPPQLRGRSNIVTEDISKLFVKRHADSSSQ